MLDEHHQRCHLLTTGWKAASTLRSYRDRLILAANAGQSVSCCSPLIPIFISSRFNRRGTGLWRTNGGMEVKVTLQKLQGPVKMASGPTKTKLRRLALRASSFRLLGSQRTMRSLIKCPGTFSPVP